jgi:hypothetical protein
MSTFLCFEQNMICLLKLLYRLFDSKYPVTYPVLVDIATFSSYGFKIKILSAYIPGLSLF